MHLAQQPALAPGNLVDLLFLSVLNTSMDPHQHPGGTVWHSGGSELEPHIPALLLSSCVTLHLILDLFLGLMD